MDVLFPPATLVFSTWPKCSEAGEGAEPSLRRGGGGKDVHPACDGALSRFFRTWRIQNIKKKKPLIDRESHPSKFIRNL